MRYKVREKKVNYLKELAFLLLLLFLLVLASIFEIDKVKTQIVFPVLFLYYLFKKQTIKLFTDKAVLYYTIFIVVSLFSIVNAFGNSEFEYSMYSSVTLKMLFTYAFVLMISSSIDNKSTRIYTFYIAYIITFYILFLYAYFSSYTFSLEANERFSESIFDPNMYGYYGVFAVFSSYFLNIRFKNKLVIINLFFISILSVIIVIIGATRGGFLMLLLSLFLILYSRMRVVNISQAKKIFALFLIFFFLIIAYNFYKYTLENTYLGNRIESASNEDGRVNLIKDAIRIGFENPIFGIGAGQFVVQNKFIKTFSHNSYAEVFSTTGFIALLFYLLIHYSIYIKIKKLRRFKDAYFQYLATAYFSFLIIFFIYNVFYVFYLSYSLFTILFVVNAHLNIMLKENIQLNKKERISYFTYSSSINY